MKKYRVEFSGFAYVEADTLKEAEEKFNDDDVCYRESEIDATEEVDDFVIEL